MQTSLFATLRIGGCSEAAHRPSGYEVAKDQLDGAALAVFAEAAQRAIGHYLANGSARQVGRSF